MTRSELLGKIYVLLGGRVAEEMIFGDVSTGGSERSPESYRDRPNNGDTIRHERTGWPGFVRGPEDAVVTPVPTQGAPRG